MKYPTSEYRRLLCLYQQLQQPEPVVYARTLREQHLLFLSATPKLVLYFTRQDKRYYLTNAKDCFGLKPFCLPAGLPGQFFTRTLKNTLCVKLHRILDNNVRAIDLFCWAVCKKVHQVFDVLVRLFQQQSYSTFMLHRSVTVDSWMLSPSRYRAVLNPQDDECRVILTLRRNGFGHIAVDMVISYTPLPFVRHQVHHRVEDIYPHLHLDDEIQHTLKTQLCQQVPALVGTFFQQQ